MDIGRAADDVWCFPHMRCHVVLRLHDLKWLFVSQGPEIRTGMLKDGQPVQLTSGLEVTITTDYTISGDSNMIAMRYIRGPIPPLLGNQS